MGEGWRGLALWLPSSSTQPLPSCLLFSPKASSQAWLLSSGFPHCLFFLCTLWFSRKQKIIFFPCWLRAQLPSPGLREPVSLSSSSCSFISAWKGLTRYHWATPVYFPFLEPGMYAYHGAASPSLFYCLSLKIFIYLYFICMSVLLECI